MNKLLIAFLLVSTLQAVSGGTYCTYYTSYSPYYKLQSYCLYDCCSYEIDGCCDAPFYVGASFIAPVVIGCVGLTIGVIVAVIVRRRRIRTTIQYGASAAPQVVTSTTASNNYGGYSNQVTYPPQPAYAPQQQYPQPPAYAPQPVRY